MTPRQAIEFVWRHGIVLEVGRGSVPSFAEAVALEPIKGSWWSHPKSKEIFALTRHLRDSDDVLVCRLVDGKITFVHRRVWPALVHLADRFPSARLAQLIEEHTSSGRHIVRTIPYPDWVSSDIASAAHRLSECEALEHMGRLLT
jgi:hypothetical protein